MISPAARNHLLALADDEHIIGARHARWIGLGPFLEEDLAFCSIAQDELGHALSLYEVLLDTTDDRLIDHFALLRSPEDYRSCWLVEAPCSTWSDALVRHWLYDEAEVLRWQALSESSIDAIARRVDQALREEVFHRSHADLLLSKVLTTTTEAKAAIEDSLGRLLPIAAGMWDPLVDEAQTLDEGVMNATAAELGQRWWTRVADQLTSWGVTASLGTNGALGTAIDTAIDSAIATSSAQQRNRMARSPEFDELLASIQEVITIDPSARW